MKKLGKRLLVCLMMAPLVVWADDSAIKIENAFARATPPGARVAGGFMMIENTGSSSDALIGGEADFAGIVEIHSMKMDGDVMRMFQLPNGLEIKAGDKAMLKPGGYHVMFMKLKEGLKEGETHKIKLHFSGAGEIEVEMEVKSHDFMGDGHMMQGGHKMGKGHTMSGTSNN